MAASTVNDRKFPGAGTKVDLGEDAPVTKESAGTVLPQSLAAESYRKDGDFAENRHAEPGKFPTDEKKSDKKDSSSDKKDSSSNKKDLSSDKQDSSLDKKDSSSNKKDLSSDKKDSSSNKKASSSDKKESSSDKKDSSTDAKGVPLVEKNLMSEDRKDISSGKTHSSSNDGASQNTAFASKITSQDTSSSGDQSRPQADTRADIPKDDFDDPRLEDGLKKALESEPGSMDDPSRLAEQKFEQGQTMPATHAGRRQTELETETQYKSLDRDTSS